MRVLLAAVAASGILVAAAPARADCPASGSPSDEVCRYTSAILMPSVLGVSYFPLGEDGTDPWFGGGVQVVLFTWNDNSPRFGPGQGKVRLDVATLGSGEDGAGLMTMFSGGATVSFERNASRSWLIPYFGASLGALHEKNFDTNGFAEGTLGFHALYTRRLILDLEAGYLFPFNLVDELAGVRAQLTASFALW